MDNPPLIERRSDRQQIFLRARARTSSWHVADAAMSDISALGCCITTNTALTRDQSVEIRHGSKKGVPGVIRWVEGNRAGVEFDTSLDEAELRQLLSEHRPAGEKVARLPLGARNTV